MVAGRTVRGIVDCGGGEASLTVSLVADDPAAEELEAPIDGPSFTFSAVPPGRYELRISLLGAGVLSRTRVDVPEGPSDEAVTLEPLQIDGGFRRITVSAVDPDGHPVDRSILHDDEIELDDEIDLDDDDGDDLADDAGNTSDDPVVADSADDDDEAEPPADEGDEE